MTVIFAILQVHPFATGKNMILTVDCYHQYAPFLFELRNKILHGESLFFSWNVGCGTNFWAVLANYSASPLNLLALFFPAKYIGDCVALLAILRCGLTGLFMSYLLKELDKDRKDLLLTSFSCFYALCGWTISYFWNIMWHDAVVLLPLIVLGLVKMFRDKKPLLYCCTLAICLLSNFYSGYFVCLFLVFYAPILYVTITEKVTLKNFWSAVWRFGVYSGLAGGLSAFLTLSTYITLQKSSATSGTFPKDFQVMNDLFDFISRFLVAPNPNIRDGMANVYCGIFVAMLIPLFFLCQKIRLREKVAYGIGLAIMYISLSSRMMTYIWHGFHFPNDLPYRFSFAYSFLLLTVGYFALQHISEFSRKYFVAAGVGVIAFIIIVSKVGSKNVDDATQIISILFVLLYVILAGLITSNAFTKKRLEFLLIVLIVLELVSADTSKFVMSQSKKNYTSDYTAYQTVSSIAEKDEHDLFYRTELSKLRARMDPSWYGYNGVSVFSSMASEKTSKMMKALGLFSNNINSYTYYPQTPVFNSFFSLKYIYDNADLLSPNDKYTSIATVENFDAYKYNYYLPLAFSVNGDIEDWDPLSNSDPFKVQNDLVRLSTGIDGVFEEVKATDVETSNVNSISLASVNGSTSFSISKVNDSSSGYAKVIIDVEKDGNYYVYAGSTKLSGIKFNAEEDVSYNYISSSIYPFVLDMGERKAGDQISVEYTLDSNSSATVTFCAAMLNQDRFESAYKSIQKNGTIQLDSFKETSFTGHINVTNANATIFTSIPFDKSWSVYVDGVKLQYAREDDTNTNGKIFAIGNGLIGFDAERGEHEIRFEYHPEGLKQGLTISAFGVCICALMILFGVRRKRKEQSALQNEVNYESVAAE
jgi:uncharacterized membrane protein YfhO